jgi:hypothetical protein
MILSSSYLIVVRLKALDVREKILNGFYTRVLRDLA